MKNLIFIVSLLIVYSESSAQSWEFIGPDSTNWQNILQMDVSFNSNRIPFIGAATSEGVCINLDGSWKYPLHNYSDFWYQSFYFSPWNDSTAFIAGDGLFNEFSEPGSIGWTIPDIFKTQWGILGQEIGGGYVGFSPSLSFEFSPHHPNNVYTWIVGFYKSTDNGEWWEDQMNYDSYGAFFLSFDQDRDSVLYAGRQLFSEQGMYRSTDDGNTWNYIRQLNITNNYPNHRFAELIAKGNTLILAINRFPYPADSNCGISISIDNGNTWNTVLSNTNVQKIIQDKFDNEIIFAATEVGIYISRNSGIIWDLYNNSLPSLNLVDIRKDPYSDTLYVASSDMGIYKVFETEVKVQNEYIPSGFSLLQNFPNPFNPLTIISYSLARHTTVNLSVYDMLGREVSLLLNKEQQQGAYEIGFNGKNLASGIYIYRLVTPEFTQSRKMILQK